MDKHVLINNDTLEIVKVVPTMEQALSWAEALMPYNDFLVVGTENKEYSCYTHYELASIYHNATGDTVPREMEYAKLLQGVVHLAKNWAVDETEAETIQEEYGVTVPDEPEPPRVAVVAAPLPDTAPSGKSRPAAAPAKAPGRPKPGSSTGKVWDIADKVLADHADMGLNAKELRATVIAQCEAEGINPSTAATQFGKWKKAQV